MPYDVGDLIFNSHNQEKCLPCDGSQYSEAGYPELAPIMNSTDVDQTGAATGYFFVPTISDKGGIPALIKAES